jgi:hypothetical protein
MYNGSALKPWKRKTGESARGRAACRVAGGVLSPCGGDGPSVDSHGGARRRLALSGGARRRQALSGAVAKATAAPDRPRRFRLLSLTFGHRFPRLAALPRPAGWRKRAAGLLVSSASPPAGGSAVFADPGLSPERPLSRSYWLAGASGHTQAPPLFSGLPFAAAPPLASGDPFSGELPLSPGPAFFRQPSPALDSVLSQGPYPALDSAFSSGLPARLDPVSSVRRSAPLEPVPVAGPDSAPYGRPASAKGPAPAAGPDAAPDSARFEKPASARGPAPCSGPAHCSGSAAGLDYASSARPVSPSGSGPCHDPAPSFEPAPFSRTAALRVLSSRTAPPAAAGSLQ